MALSDTDLHWIPMNRDKFNQLRKMFDKADGKTHAEVARPCEKCTSPRIRYSSAENVTALSQIRALLRPVEPDDSSTSSRSRNTSEDSVDGCNNNIRDNKSPRLPNGFVVIDPVACQKSNGFLKLNGSAEVLSNINSINHLKESEVDPLLLSNDNSAEITYNFTDNTITTAVDEKPLVIKSLENIELPEVKSLEKIITDHVTTPTKIVTTPAKIVTTADTIDSKKEHVMSAEDSDNSLDENKFRQYVNDEADRLGKKREYWVNLLDGGQHTINEEVTGRIMATCGKANLLLTSKFKQYRTLCTEYEEKSAKMTSDDMQGFWELILLQVNDVNKMFDECRVMEKSGWQPPKSPMPPKKKATDTPVKTRGTKTPAKPKAKSAAQIARDEARRKMMSERKEQMKLAKLNAANTGTIEIFT